MTEFESLAGEAIKKVGNVVVDAHHLKLEEAYIDL